MKNIDTIKLTGILGIAAAGAIIAGGMGIGSTLLAASDAEGTVTGDINAEELFRAECAACHGRDGKGETRAGRRAGVEDLSEHKKQLEFSDQRAFMSIKAGMTENGDEQMKPFGKEFSDENGLTDEEIVALVEYVREFDPQEWTEALNKAAFDADEELDKLNEFIREHGPEKWK